MKITRCVSKVAFTLVLVFTYLPNTYAQPLPTRPKTQDSGHKTQDPNRKTQDVRIGSKILSPGSGVLKSTGTASDTLQEIEKAIPKANFVTMVDFYLRDGKLVSGRLASEDRNKIIVEHCSASKIILSTYSKREADTRTIRTRSIPQGKYYLDLAEYFTGRIWDFEDDPDDFIQAIRCYEKAKQAVGQNQSPPTKTIQQIDKRIQQLQADRQAWEKEAQQRNKLRKLEFEAMMQARITNLENKINENNQRIDESMRQLTKLIADMRDNQNELKKDFSTTTEDLSRQLEILGDRINSNRILIARLYRWGSFPLPY